ncbi:hypothetical protein, partial [Pseudomonas sp. GW456-12-1-14-TSB6]|uniref:hypothetical protein n=1 Tax=Pseudomonas sp. GW456-12-1-14-TSB6 TaxID=2751350 RepID=UPI001C44316C
NLRLDHLLNRRHQLLHKFPHELLDSLKKTKEAAKRVVAWLVRAHPMLCGKEQGEVGLSSSKLGL